MLGMTTFLELAQYATTNKIVIPSDSEGSLLGL